MAQRKPGRSKQPERRPEDIPPADASGPTVVGIGASAGGLSALSTLFEHVPPDSGLAWVVVVHLNPDHESHLADLLQPHVRIPVEQVTDVVRLEPDRVYVIPPGANLTSVDTHLRPSKMEGRRLLRAPIDHFFRTLANTHRGNAVGVILSGTGSDGALGLKAIKEGNGFAVVQDPGEAEYDGMPQSAIATGLVDEVLRLADIPAAVIRFARTEPRVQVPVEGEEVDGELRRALQQIFAVLQSRTGRDFTKYKRSTLLRRIQRRMQIRQVEELGAYLGLLRQEAQEAHALGEDLLITVTSFFRDPAIWQQLEEEIIPSLFEDRGADESVRAWSVGCATGEEAYSLAMLLLEEAARRDEAPCVQVFASDLHERSLARARDGFYPGDIGADVSPERLRRFFQKEDGGYRVRKEVRECVIFAPHNLLRDPPFSRLDLVACRNVMIYLQREVQREILGLFHYALRPGGVLVLGTSETVDGSDLFRVDNKASAIFRRGSVRAVEPRLPLFPLPYAPSAARRRPTEVAGAPLTYGGLHQQMAEQYAPPSMLVGPDGRVVHLSEHAGRYLALRGGEPTMSAVNLVPEELRLELQALLRAAAESKQAQRSRPISVRLRGEAAAVVLDVRPGPEPDYEGFVLVIFDERPEAAPEPATDTAAQAGPGSREAALQSELEQYRQRIRALIEEYEAGQEEARASTEELQSANEELRSTMEELETSKEELQSMNEELQALNQENRHKVEELSQLSADLQNLLTSTDIATLFLDRELRILRFTPKVGVLFNVRPVDRGRPLLDLTNRLGYPELEEDARLVLRTLVPVEREVRDEAGKWYMTRVLPYRSRDDRIEGVVITFLDITERRLSEDALRVSEERNRLIVESARDYAILTTDADGRIQSWSAGAEAVFGWSAAEVMGQPVDITFTPQDRAQGVPAAELEAASAAGSAPDVRWHVRKQGTPIFIEGTARALRDDAGAVRGFLKIGQDLTQRREVEEALRGSEARFRTVANLVPDLLWQNLSDGTVVWYNERWYAYTGLPTESALQEGWEVSVHPEDRPAVHEAYRAALTTAQPYQLEARLRAADGSHRWFLVRGEPVPDGGRDLLWLGGASDVHEQRLARAQLEARMRDRTAELARSNEDLAGEVAQRQRAEESRRIILRQLVTADEDARRRISRELHDQMGQQITGLLLGLRAAQQDAAAPGAVERLRELEQLAAGISREMQHLALELRPPALDNLGLGAALENHLAEWSERHGIEYDFHTRGLDAVPLAPEVETTIYRAMQEGLTNVLKHARAGHVSLILERRDGTISAILEDNGVGFDWEATQHSPEKARRLGLRGMRERAALHGGEVEIESSPGAGTTLFVRIPEPSAVSSGEGEEDS